MFEMVWAALAALAQAGSPAGATYHQRCTASPSVSADARTFAGLCGDGAIEVYDRAGVVLRRVSAGPVRNIWLTPDGGALLISVGPADLEQPGRMLIARTRDAGQALGPGPGPGPGPGIVFKSFLGPVISPSADRFILPSMTADDGWILYDMNGAEIATIRGDVRLSLATGRSTLFTLDGRYVVTGVAGATEGAAPELLFWRTTDGVAAGRLTLAAPASGAAVSTAPEVAASGGARLHFIFNELGLYDIDRRQVLARATPPGIHAAHLVRSMDGVLRLFGQGLAAQLGADSVAPVPIAMRDPVDGNGLATLVPDVAVRPSADGGAEVMTIDGIVRVVERGTRRELACFAASRLLCGLGEALVGAEFPHAIPAEIRLQRVEAIIAAADRARRGAASLPAAVDLAELRIVRAEWLAETRDHDAALAGALGLSSDERPAIAGRAAIVVANVYLVRRDYRRLATFTRSALDMLAKKRTADGADITDDQQFIELIHLHARAKLMLGDPRTAAAIAAEGIERANALLEPWMAGGAISDLTNVYTEALDLTGRQREAEAIRAVAVEQLADKAEIHPLPLARALTSLAGSEFALGRPAQALLLMVRARDLLRAQVSEASEATIAAQAALGRALLLHGSDAPAAVAELRIAAIWLQRSTIMSEQDKLSAEAAAAREDPYRPLVSALWAVSSPAPASVAPRPEPPTAAGAIIGHHGPVTAIGFAPNGRTLYSVGLDGALLQWDVASGALVRRQPSGHSAGLWSIAVSRDHIFTVARDGMLLRWSRAALTIDRSDDKGTGALAISRDGRTVAVAAADDVGLFDTATMVRTGTIAMADVRALAIADDGRTIATLQLKRSANEPPMTFAALTRASLLGSLVESGQDGLGIGRCVWQPPYASGACEDLPVLAAAFVPGSTTLLEGTGRVVADLGADRVVTQASATNALAIAPDGSFGVAAGASSEAVIFAMADGRIVARLRGHVREVTGAAISPAGDMIATASKDSRIRLWDRQGRLLRVLGGERSLFGHSAPLRWVEFSTDDRFVTTAAEDLSLRRWDAATGDMADSQAWRIAYDRTWIPPTSWMASVGERRIGNWPRSDFTPDDPAMLIDRAHRRVALIGSQGISVIDETKAVRATMKVPGAVDAAFSPDGATLAVTTPGGVTLWDWAADRRLAEYRGVAGVAAVRFDPAGNRLFVAGEALVVLDGASGREIARSPKIATATTIEVAPDGGMVAVASADGIALFDARSMRLLASGRQVATSLRFGASMIAIGLADGTVEIVDGRTLAVRHRVKAAADRITDLGFDKAGGRLVVASADMDAVIVDVGTGRVLTVLGGMRAP